MVDVFVGAAQFPLVAVAREIAFHVVVNQLLQIDSARAERANHHIGASARAVWDIAARIGDFSIRRVVCVALLRARRRHDFSGDGIGNRNAAHLRFDDLVETGFERARDFGARKNRPEFGARHESKRGETEATKNEEREGAGPEKSPFSHDARFNDRFNAF